MDLATKLNLALICHLVGDYWLQSDWMATEKTKRTWVALVHAATYSLPFLLLTRSPAALALICLSHALVDRFRLARYLCWAKNWLAPWGRYRDGGVSMWIRPNKPWRECTGTGYDPSRPAWLTTWLLIITDNAMHLCFNAAALYLFR